MVRKRPILHDARSAALIRDVSFDLVIKSSRLFHKARKPVKEVEGDRHIDDIKWQCGDTKFLFKCWVYLRAAR